MKPTPTWLAPPDTGSPATCDFVSGALSVMFGCGLSVLLVVTLATVTVSALSPVADRDPVLLVEVEPVRHADLHGAGRPRHGLPLHRSLDDLRAGHVGAGLERVRRAAGAVCGVQVNGWL